MSAKFWKDLNKENNWTLLGKQIVKVEDCIDENSAISIYFSDESVLIVFCSCEGLLQYSLKCGEND